MLWVLAGAVAALAVILYILLVFARLCVVLNQWTDNPGAWAGFAHRWNSGGKEER